MSETAPLLIFGRHGQVAQALVHAAAQRNIPVASCGQAECDLSTASNAEISALFEKFRPWAVVNAAAYTQVDKAETDIQTAYALNRDAVRHLTENCKKRDLPFIHLSTDYVFDGSKGAPYLESDPVAPLGIYGKSKEAGEREALAFCKSVILRTSWVYSATGKNFVKTILRAAAERPVLKVVNDQKGCPTSAPALAKLILTLLEKIKKQGWQDAYHGIFHACGTGSATWFDFTAFLLSVRNSLGLPLPELLPVPTSEYPTPAKRPADSRLDCGKLEKIFGLKMPPWQESSAQIAKVLLTSEPR